MIKCKLSDCGFKHEQWGRYSYGSQRIATCERCIGGKESLIIHIGASTVNWLLSDPSEENKAFVLFDCNASEGSERICGGFELPSDLRPMLGCQTADRYFWSAESGNLVIRLRKEHCWPEFSRQQLGDAQFQQLFA